MKKFIPIFALCLFALLSCEKSEDGHYSVDRVVYPGSLITRKNTLFYTSAIKDSVIKVKANYAVIQGKFTSVGVEDNIERYGHCWSTTNPPYVTTDESNWELCSDPIKIGNFTVRTDSLFPETKYYVRSFAISKNGKDTAYNPVVDSFTTASYINAWFKRKEFSTQGIKDAAYFSIRQDIYLVGGHDGLNYLRSVWCYNAEFGTWSQKTTLGGEPRSCATGFGANGKGYIIGGEDRKKDVRNDVWEFTPESNEWQRKVDFPRGKRKNASAFVVTTESGKDRCYYGLGELKNGSCVGDFSEYVPSRDPGYGGSTENVWIEVAPINEYVGRASAVSFSISGMGFIGTGFTRELSGDSTFHKDLFRYEPSSQIGVDKGVWVRCLSMPVYAPSRANAVAFSIDEMGYVGTGETQEHVLLRDFYQYDPFNDRWTRVIDFGIDQTGRPLFSIQGLKDAVGCQIYVKKNSKVISRGFVGSGFNGEIRVNHWLEYLPDNTNQ